MQAHGEKTELTDAERDELLLQRAAGGDEEAVEQLLEAYKPLVLARTSAYFLKGGERDDLIQEAMIALFRAIRSCPKERRRSFSSYAWQAVDHRLQDAVRADSTKNNQIMHSSLSLEQSLPSYNESARQERELGDTIQLKSARDPEELALIQEEWEGLRSFIRNQLSEREQTVLLAFGSGESYREIAARLRTTEKSVDSALQRARRKLLQYRGRKQRDQAEES